MLKSVEKLLSIIIPTYNMQDLLPDCLNSLTESDVLDRLDILIVNDGSTDNSLDIALSYQAKHPEGIRVIDKTNGNYGSTINAALPMSKGKYVKILDSDDLFDTEELNKFVRELDMIDSDIVVSHFTQIHNGKTREVVKYNTMGREPYQYGRRYFLDDVLKDGYIRFFLIHSMTYRCSMLKEHNYRQTEGISYTDVEWSVFPLYYAETVTFLNINLYLYNLGRPGQTTSIENYFISRKQLIQVTDSVLDYYTSYDKNLITKTRNDFLRQFCGNRIRLLFKLFLIDTPRKDFDNDDFTKAYDKYAPFIKENKLVIKLFPDNKILRINVLRYWEKHNDRIPSFVERINQTLDIFIKFLYVKIIRR